MQQIIKFLLLFIYFVLEKLFNISTWFFLKRKEKKSENKKFSYNFLVLKYLFTICHRFYYNHFSFASYVCLNSKKHKQKFSMYL